MAVSDDHAENPSEPSSPHRAEKSPRILSHRTIVVCAVALILLAGGLAWLLLAHYGDGSTSSNARLDAIRTVGTLVLGAGGAIGLLLAARRQQTAELDLAHKRRVQEHAEKLAAENHAHQVRVALNTEADATQRRITELFDAAVDKLGSDKAAVRFGGLYALERLAGHAPDQQRAISAVLCAYLRMPYLPPGDDPGPDADDETRLRYERRREEREVRLAVQRVLGEHLRPDRDPRTSDHSYWRHADINLGGATLIDLTWMDCHLPSRTHFTGTIFLGETRFAGTTFTSANFNGAEFTEFASFMRSRFNGWAGFSRTVFHERTSFRKTHFSNRADFAAATFLGESIFEESTFHDFAIFRSSTFSEVAQFESSKFAKNAVFERDARVNLHNARARVANLGDSADPPRREWPEGWSLSADSTPLHNTGVHWGKLVNKSSS